MFQVMAFRANEAAMERFERACTKLLSPRELSADQISAGKVLLDDLSIHWGPVVDWYPSWHPLVSSGKKEAGDPVTSIGPASGYAGIDHSVCFRNAFISCPYSNGDELIDAVDSITFPSCVEVTAQKLDCTLYHPNATPVLVTCDWQLPSQIDGTISQRCALALMLQDEIPAWEAAQVAETWDTMRPYFLGQPCGSKSSLFVNQKTGQAMKKIWEAVIMGGVFGPIKVDR